VSLKFILKMMSSSRMVLDWATQESPSLIS